jgi:hypothetical protein
MLNHSTCTDRLTRQLGAVVHTTGLPVPGAQRFTAGIAIRGRSYREQRLGLQLVSDSGEHNRMEAWPVWQAEKLGLLD